MKVVNICGGIISENGFKKRQENNFKQNNSRQNENSSRNFEILLREMMKR